MTETGDWSPDEPLGTETFEQGDEAVDEERDAKSARPTHCRGSGAFLNCPPEGQEAGSGTHRSF